MKVLPLAALITACGGGPSDPKKPGATPTPTPAICSTVAEAPELASDAQMSVVVDPACEFYKAGQRIMVRFRYRTVLEGARVRMFFFGPNSDGGEWIIPAQGGTRFEGNGSGAVEVAISMSDPRQGISFRDPTDPRVVYGRSQLFEVR